LGLTVEVRILTGQFYFVFQKDLKIMVLSQQKMKWQKLKGAY
jgi:hypothetical protein